MVIKVKGAGQAIPLPATAGQIAEIQTDLNIVTPTAAQILISANSNLGALAPSVQTLINDAVANAIKRANHTGNDPATNVVFAADGLSLEAWRIQVTTALANAGSSAPVNTAQPVAATGTTTVNSVLTAATGTWTGASTYLYQWYQQNATTGVRTPIVGAVSSTYTQLAADIGFKIIYTVAGVSAAGVTATPVFAAGPTAAATTGTAPTNSGTVPTITGSAPSGSAIGYDVGVWTGATTWGIQLYDNNVAVGSRVTVSATTGSLTTSTTGQVGHVLKIDVIGYSSLNVPSASAITSSNTITVTGVTPPVVNTAVPVWGATLQLEVQNDFTPGTWTGTINVARTWDFYKVASPNDILVRAGNTVDLYTPHASEGVAVGDNLYIIETVTETATGNTTTARSVNKAIASTPVALAATTNNTGLVWTQNSAITAVIPVTATGGTTPYTYTCSGLPTGLSMASATGLISGTPSGIVSPTTYTVSITDSAGSPATVTSTFTAQVQAAGITPLTVLPMLNSNGTSNSAVEAYGFDIAYTGQTILGADSVVRHQRLTNILGTGQNGSLRRIKQGDPISSGSGLRAENSWDSQGLVQGIHYWWGFAINPIAAEWPGSEAGIAGMVFWQIHQANVAALPGPTLELSIADSSSPFYIACVKNPFPVGTPQYPYVNVAGKPTAGVWNRYIVHCYFSATSGGTLELWKNETLLYSSTTIGIGQDQGSSNTYYSRIGLYKPGSDSSGSWGAKLSRAAYFSENYFQQGTNLYANAVAALAPFA